MPTKITLDSVLNFIIPIAVYGFIIYVIYRIPLVKEGVSKLRDWYSNRKEKVNETEEASVVKRIIYE